MELTQKQINYCMECGICTGSCPVSMEHPDFSPRQFIKHAMLEPDSSFLNDRKMWSCLSCARCSIRCPAGIDFPEVSRELREKARQSGNVPRESHHGIFQTITELQSLKLKQKRNTWAQDTGSFKKSGELFYFVGCLPYIDLVIDHFKPSSLEIARSVLKLLNLMGIEPVISNDECCCGHDALWSGNKTLFLELSRKNIETIKSVGARTVVFSCPEGYYTFKNHYPEYHGELPFEVIHFMDLFLQRAAEFEFNFSPSFTNTVTFQDPCRLGRLAGEYDLPRRLLKLIPGIELIEMEQSRENALCCGTSAWLECSGCSKSIQTQRLEEAEKTGASTLITACPKCHTHLTCALNDLKLNLQIKDICVYLSERINTT